MQEAKARLRKKMRALESTLTEDYLRESNEKIFKALISRREYKEAEKIFVYYSIKNEVDTKMLIKHALGTGKTVALPKITGKGTMDAAVIGSESDLKADKFDIPAPITESVLSPDEIDLVIVPGAAFTKDGLRLGKGGGFYDRFLAGCGAFKIALARKYMILDEIPVNEFDVKADLVITD